MYGGGARGGEPGVPRRWEERERGAHRAAASSCSPRNLGSLGLFVLLGLAVWNTSCHLLTAGFDWSECELVNVLVETLVET